MSSNTWSSGNHTRTTVKRNTAIAKAWHNFAVAHPQAAQWIWQVGIFYLFSLLLTFLQYALFTVLPYAFGIELAGTEFMWPRIPISFAGMEYNWNILGYEVAHNAAGEVIIGGGLGYFISYELGSFIAQCINFPLQRNIVFRSHGNVGRQIAWYFLAWVLISLLCNAVNGLWLPIAQACVNPAVYNILVTVITGGVSMVIYFFAFKIIFPTDEAIA